MEPKLEKINAELKNLLFSLPNIPFDSVPVGKDESGNKVIRKWGRPTKFNFEPKDHVEIGENLDLIDIETAGKVSGTRFAYLKNQAAIIQYALVQYVFSVLTSEKIVKKIAESVKRGFSSKLFSPMVVPVMIKPDVYTKMARLSPEDKDERYYIPSDDVYLIGSAEHTLGPIHMDEIIPEASLPLRYVSFSNAFRREAGSYGKDLSLIHI